MAVADFMTKLEVASREHAGVEVIHEPEIIAAAPEPTQRAREPLRWVVWPKGSRNEVWSVIPDGLFALSFADGTAAYFLLEIDRGTIPIARNSLDHRSITRKLAAYYEGWSQPARRAVRGEANAGFERDGISGASEEYAFRD